MNPDSLAYADSVLLAAHRAAASQRLALALLVLTVLAALALVYYRQSRQIARASMTDAERLALEAIARSPVVLWTADREGNTERIRLSVGGGLAALGIKPGELVGTSLEDFHAADPNAEALKIARRVMDTGHEETAVTTYTVPATGETRHYLTAFVPTTSGKVVGLAATVMDVTTLVDEAESRRVETVTLRRRLDRLDTRARAAEQEAKALRSGEKARQRVGTLLEPKDLAPTDAE
ncbi:MAG: PAS domain-containing protein [Bacteroidetes bacterium]|nr:PAS domain-containing protein [Bacteroidota bacterium]